MAGWVPADRGLRTGLFRSSCDVRTFEPGPGARLLKLRVVLDRLAECSPGTAPVDVDVDGKR